jgi:dUTP pyrophosphatase
VDRQYQGEISEVRKILSDMSLVLNIKRLDHAKELSIPAYATPDAAGLDLCSASKDVVEIHPGQRVLVPTGLVMEIPRGYEGQVRPRSGLALKYGISLVNTPGTIDSDYRGEVKIILINLGDQPFKIHYGDRIAQLVIAPVIQAHIQEVDELTDSARGQGGFGSTGV